MIPENKFNVDRQLPEHQSGGRGLRIHFQLVSLEEVDHKGRGEPAQTDGWTHRRTDGRTDGRTVYLSVNREVRVSKFTPRGRVWWRLVVRIGEDRQTDGQTDSLPGHRAGGQGLRIHFPRASLVEVGRKNREEPAQTDGRTDGRTDK